MSEESIKVAVMYNPKLPPGMLPVPTVKGMLKPPPPPVTPTFTVHFCHKSAKDSDVCPESLES
jgi:hypothetical protein